MPTFYHIWNKWGSTLIKTKCSLLRKFCSVYYDLQPECFWTLTSVALKMKGSKILINKKLLSFWRFKIFSQNSQKLSNGYTCSVTSRWITAKLIHFLHQNFIASPSFLCITIFCPFLGICCIKTCLIVKVKHLEALTQIKCLERAQNTFLEEPLLIAAST